MNGRLITETEQQVLKLYTQLMRASNAVTERMHPHLSEKKLTLSQFGVLEALYHLGPLSQKAIGEKILKSSGNITLVIDNLKKRGLVKRERDERDRRCFMVSLTSKGKELIQTIFPCHAANAETVFNVLSIEEQKTLGALLKKLGKSNSRADKTI